MASAWGRAARLALAAAVLCASNVALGARPAAATAIPAFNLDLPLTVSDALQPLARRMLLAEANRIWEREGVRLHWSDPMEAAPPADASLRVLVLARPEPASANDRRWPVAELVPHASPRALAIASIPGAQRVVDEAARFRLVEPGGDSQIRLGLVLGRAVAHEIGHFLLATATHSESGLMRAAVDSGEFVSIGDHTFKLDPEARRSLRQRLQ